MDIKYELLASRYDGSSVIRGLGNSWVFSHSEASTIGCPRLWTYSYMESYEGGKRSPTLMYGSIWHLMCEWFLLNVREDESKFIDPEYCKQQVLNNFGSWCDEEFKDLSGEHYSSYDLDEMYEDFKARMINALEGWRRHVYENILPFYEIIDVELEVYAPIIKSDGKPFKPRQYVVSYEMGNGNCVYRPAFTHENSGQEFRSLTGCDAQIKYEGNLSISSEVKMVYWKWFKIGKIDALLRKKGTKQLWVLDHKTTTSVGSYESKMSLDTQLEGYAYLLRNMLDNDDKYKQYKDHEICGLLWNLCHSKVPKQPEPLMSGKLSMAKKSIPSWQYEKSVDKLISEEEVTEEDIEKYKAHIKYCRDNFDQKYFRLCENYISEASFERIEAENYAVAKKIAELRRNLCNVDYKNVKKFSEVAYRYPLCSRNGNCSFASMCVADNTPSVILNKQKPKLIWTKHVTN